MTQGATLQLLNNSHLDEAKLLIPLRDLNFFHAVWGFVALSKLCIFAMNLMWQMVWESRLWKLENGRHLKKYLAGNRTNHLSTTIYHGLASTNHINSWSVLPPVEPVGKSNSCQSQSTEEWKLCFQPERPSVPVILFQWNQFSSSYNWCYSNCANFWRTAIVCLKWTGARRSQYFLIRR